MKDLEIYISPYLPKTHWLNNILTKVSYWPMVLIMPKQPVHFIMPQRLILAVPWHYGDMLTCLGPTSESIKIDNPDNKLKIRNLDLDIVKNLKKQEGSDIYLCGGGEFAGWLLENELVDDLKIKLNPIVLGSGIRIFGSSKKQYKMHLKNSESFTLGLQIITYQMLYKKITPIINN